MTKQEERLARECQALKDTLRRIAIAYPEVAGPDECPPSPHACDKCEIYFLLEEAGFLGEEAGT